MGRPPGELSIASVERAEARLLERREVTSVGGRGKGKHSYEAIATYAGLTRDRVVEIEQLMVVGWPLRESQPDFPRSRGSSDCRRRAKPHSCCVRVSPTPNANTESRGNPYTRIPRRARLASP